MKEVPRVTHCVGPGGGGSTSVATMSGMFSPRNPTQNKRLTSVTVGALYEVRRGRRSWNQLRTSDLQKNVIGCEREARDERRQRARPAYWLEQITSGVIHLYGTPVRTTYLIGPSYDHARSLYEFSFLHRQFPQRYVKFILHSSCHLDNNSFLTIIKVIYYLYYFRIVCQFLTL